MLTFIYITNKPDIARAAVNAGVGRIFVDLEILGKYERQGMLDTVISRHTLDDVCRIREAVPDAELLVRLNPLNKNTEQEVESVVNAGADLIMLPMFHTFDEIKKLSDFVRCRVGIVPLVETLAALNIVQDLVKIDCVVEVYIGLNDLHLDLKSHFIFQPLADGLIDPVANTVKQSGVRFGFGGVARVGEGIIPGEMVLGEHLRLGSDSVILSRTFFRYEGSEVSSESPTQIFSEEIEKLRMAEGVLSARTKSEILRDHYKFVRKVEKVVNLRQEEE